MTENERFQKFWDELGEAVLYSWGACNTQEYDEAWRDVMAKVRRSIVLKRVILGIAEDLQTSDLRRHAV